MVDSIIQTKKKEMMRFSNLEVFQNIGGVLAKVYHYLKRYRF